MGNRTGSSSLGRCEFARPLTVAAHGGEASGVGRLILDATRRLAAATSDGEFDSALSVRERHVSGLARADAADVEELRASLALGEQVRVALLRSIVEDRAALERLRAMTPACHAQSSVACTG